MGTEQTTEGKASTPLDPRKEQIKFYADIMLKLSPVIATLVLGFVTYHFQSNNAAANLLNQREQAETQLRTALFENLIGPIGGSTKEQFDAEDQSLFVELLMLNFHEHIEFKPLLIHTDQRLADEVEDGNKRILARNSLQSVTRRVRDRQVNILAKECLRQLKNDNAQLQFEEDENPCEPQEHDFYETDSVFHDESANESPTPWEVWSPQQESKLEILVMEMDWEELKFKLDIKIYKNENGHPKLVDESSFSVTPFDLPFTDNMMIYGQQRFALGVSYIAPQRSSSLAILNKFVTIQAIWFPDGYILPHERPVNYVEIRNMLDLDD